MNLTKQSLIYTVAKLFSLVSLLFINLFLSKVLSAESYAEYGQVTAVFSFLMLFNWGVPTYLEKVLSKEMVIDVFSIWLNYLLVLCVSLGLIIFMIQRFVDFSVHLSFIVYASSLFNLNSIFCIVILRKRKKILPIIVYLLSLPLSFLFFSVHFHASLSILFAYMASSIPLLLQFEIHRLFVSRINLYFFRESLTIFFYNTLVYGSLLLPRLLYGDIDPELYSKYTFTWFLSNTIMLAIQSLTFMLQPRLYSMIVTDPHTSLQYNKLYRSTMLLITLFLVLIIQGLNLVTDLMSSYDNRFFVLSVLLLFQMAGQQGFSQKFIVSGKILHFALPLITIPLVEIVLFESGISLTVCLIIVNLVMIIVNIYRKINLVIELLIISALLYANWIFVLLVLFYIGSSIKSRISFAKNSFS